MKQKDLELFKKALKDKTVYHLKMMEYYLEIKDFTTYQEHSTALETTSDILNALTWDYDYNEFITMWVNEDE